jgi:putative RNA 2'-phosphotransferase
MKLEDLSRVVSHALRHEPWLYELELDDEGWADLDVLLVALRSERRAFESLSRADIEQMIAASTKRRYEVRGSLIRALYGHSMPGRLRRTRQEPPAVLFHGTSPLLVETILRDGLRPMSRQYVHLSVETAMALEVGRRKADPPSLLELDANAAHGSGIVFYEGNDKVWLADCVPGRFLRVVGH